MFSMFIIVISIIFSFFNVLSANEINPGKKNIIGVNYLDVTGSTQTKTGSLVLGGRLTAQEFNLLGDVIYKNGSNFIYTNGTNYNTLIGIGISNNGNYNTVV